jgi:nicotinamide-nucleotide adenylyltransferase
MEKFDFLIIGIGSAQESGTLRNPFSLEERREMIRRALAGYEGRYEIIAIPDFFNARKWRSYCLRVAQFDVVITGSGWTRSCFEGFVPVIEPDFLKPHKYKASRIRRLMAEGRRWTHLVPRPVVELIEQIGGVERIKKLMGATR